MWYSASIFYPLEPAPEYAALIVKTLQAIETMNVSTSSGTLEPFLLRLTPKSPALVVRSILASFSIASVSYIMCFPSAMQSAGE